MRAPPANMQAGTVQYYSMRGLIHGFICHSTVKLFRDQGVCTVRIAVTVALEGTTMLAWNILLVQYSNWF
jgi:hypothetical protein